MRILAVMDKTSHNRCPMELWKSSPGEVVRLNKFGEVTPLGYRSLRVDRIINSHQSLWWGFRKGCISTNRRSKEKPSRINPSIFLCAIYLSGLTLLHYETETNLSILVAGRIETSYMGQDLHGLSAFIGTGHLSTQCIDPFQIGYFSSYLKTTRNRS